MTQRLTLDTAKRMPYQDFLEAMKSMVDAYNKPDEPETEDEQRDRLTRGLDELPAIYGFLLQIHAMLDHWTDFYAMQEGQGVKATEYRSYRQKRDAAEDMARYAKMRYEGTSRVVTMKLGFTDESQMPRGRG